MWHHLLYGPENLELQPYDSPKVDVWSQGVILRMATGKLSFVRNNFGELKQHIFFEWTVPCTTLYSSRMSKTVEKLMTVYLSQRTTPNGVMKYPWVNIGQEEEMKPYRELPWGDISTHITEIMKNLKFKQHKI